MWGPTAYCIDVTQREMADGIVRGSVYSSMHHNSSFLRQMRAVQHIAQADQSYILVFPGKIATGAHLPICAWGKHKNRLSPRECVVP